VKWQDNDGGWHVGHVLTYVDRPIVHYADQYTVQCCDGIYEVDRSRLSLYIVSDEFK
jgi:hypothetical protein